MFYPSRIVGHKRQRLVAEAAAYLRTDVRIVIAGVPDDGHQLAQVREAIDRAGANHRVTLIPRWITEEEKADLIARSLAVLYVPFDEDSYGYVTLEAFQSHKPVITCSDSGGSLELVNDGHNGLVVARQAGDAGSSAIDRLRAHPVQAATMGEHAFETLRLKDISWTKVVERPPRMRVAEIVNNQAPFVRGGPLLGEWLAASFRSTGTQSSWFAFPFQWNPPERIIDHLLAARLFRLGGAERVVAFKFPTYFVPHDNKVVWLLHQFRQAYDLWGTPYQENSRDEPGEAIREAIIAADHRHLRRQGGVFTNSPS